MTSFARFQERNKKRADSISRNNTSFIIRGYNSTVITKDDIEIYAAIVNEQEKDIAYVYTGKTDTLDIGTIWTAKESLHLLISKEIVIIKDVDWHKYQAILCNVQVGDYWGRFIGPEESYVNVELKQNISIVSKQKPILVLPSNALKIGDKVILQGRPWLVQEEDSLSTSGISYYSLTATTVSKTAEEQDNYIETKETVYDASTDKDHNIYSHNTNITVNTENGYFQSDNANIKIISRNASTVVFQIPFGIDKLTIATKQDGTIISTVYEAK